MRWRGQFFFYYLVGTLNYWCTSISCYYMQQQKLSRIQKPPKNVTDNFCEGDLKFALYPPWEREWAATHTTRLNNQCSLVQIGDDITVEFLSCSRGRYMIAASAYRLRHPPIPSLHAIPPPSVLSHPIHSSTSTPTPLSLSLSQMSVHYSPSVFI